MAEDSTQHSSDDSDGYKEKLAEREKVVERATANRFKRAQTAIGNCDGYFGSLLDDGLLEKMLAQEDEERGRERCNESFAGQYVLTDAPRSKKMSLRWLLCRLTSTGMEKLEVKYAAGDLLMGKTKEKMKKWTGRMKLTPVKRPMMFEEKNILAERRDEELEGIFEMGRMSRTVVGLGEERRVDAIQVRVQLDEDRIRRLAEITLKYIDTGNMNIQRIWGGCVRDKDFSVILEDVAGPVSKCLSSGDRSKLSSWSRDLHSALLYLEQSDLVHYRLCLDVCLVSSSQQLKLAVFCLTAGLVPKQVYRQDVDSCRWIPWECVTGAAYTAKSVVWTFGTLLWSFYHYGATPFENHPEAQIKDKDFRRNYELAFEMSLFPNSVQEVVGNCWQDEENRPSLFGLKHLVDKL